MLPKRAMLIATNRVVTQWGTVFGDEVLAAAILDRLPQLHADDPWRELPAEAEGQDGPAGGRSKKQAN